ncbi:MAG: hypothetical protein ISN29_07540 [Gammaproteobacteria bacterium AqS3]|nr:hypothetical protein [Gammaproteobacteria bacterium AqS3]
MTDEKRTLKGGPETASRRSRKRQPKQHPYSFSEARGRLSPMLEQTVEHLSRLPDKACPDDTAVVGLTLHPEYIAKSYFPGALLRDRKVEVVGSIPVDITPEKRSRGRPPEKMRSTQLFARATREVFKSWCDALPDWQPDSQTLKDNLRALESISALEPRLNIRGEFERGEVIEMELVLHVLGFENAKLLKLFSQYLESIGLDDALRDHYETPELCYCGVGAPVERAGDIARFSAVRVLRTMPRLRKLEPPVGILRQVPFE